MLGAGRRLARPGYDVSLRSCWSRGPRVLTDGRLTIGWLSSVGLELHLYGTHSLRRTKASLIYRRTGNLRAVQLLLGHSKIESTVRYLGIEVDDAIAISEQID